MTASSVSSGVRKFSTTAARRFTSTAERAETAETLPALRALCSQRLKCLVKAPREADVLFDRPDGRDAGAQRIEEPGLVEQSRERSRQIGCVARRVNSRPFVPSVTISGMPPIRDATTGIPARNASWMTSGAFSGQIDGTTRTSIDASAAATAS